MAQRTAQRRTKKPPIRRFHLCGDDSFFDAVDEFAARFDVSRAEALRQCFMLVQRALEGRAEPMRAILSDLIHAGEID